MLAKDYKKLKTIAKKSHTLPWIDKKIGLPFTLHKYRKRKAFVLGLFIFALIIYMLSLNIWNISVNGGRTYTKETILQFLETQDVYVGKKIKDIDCRAIEENIRESYTNNSKTKYGVKILSKVLNLYKYRIPYERYDIITEEIIFQPVTNFYFPLSIIKLNLYEYIEVEKIYTENEAKDLAKTRLNRVLRKLEENDVIIQNNSVKFQTNKKSCTATGNIVVEESIIDYKIVNEHEWRMETDDELIGDDN